MKKVNRWRNQIGSGNCVKSSSAHAQSNLCQKCKSQGWIFISMDVRGKILYYNTETKESKHL